MKRGMAFNGVETFTFGSENKLRIFPPNSYKFKPKDHIVLNDVQECILDNFWFQYNNKREEKGYMLSILNSLAEYFNTINELMPTSENIQAPEHKPIYVIYDGKAPGVYISFEEIISQKMETKYDGGISFKKYAVIDEALAQARKILGINYYIEPAAKEYIQMHKKAKSKKAPIHAASMLVKDQGTSKKPSYKECLMKKVDPLDDEYVDWKLEEKFEKIYPQWKKEVKEEILQELKKEIKEQFDNMKKDYEKFDIDQFLTDEDKMDIGSTDTTMDIGGHGQKPE